MAPATDRTYDRSFYDAIRPGCQASAAAVVPVIAERVGHLGTVVDVGCGEGWWAQAFLDAGATEAVGLDGGRVGDKVNDVDVVATDLTKPIHLDRVFDLAVCLEVAEHLPAGRAESFVADLCALAPSVVFSAAMPRQGGTGHINCQPPGYWAGLFAAAGHYVCDGSLRWSIWDHPDVEPWYKSNLFIFSKVARKAKAPAPGAGPLHVIHPDLWLEPRR